MKSFVFIPIFITCFTFTAFAKDVNPDSLQINYHDRWFAADKAHHFITSAYLAALGNYIAQQELSYSKGRSISIAVGFSFSFGLYKEIYDGTIRKRHFSYKDLAADCIGIAAGLIIFNNVE